MALISCPECGNQCSDQAEACPKCGYPFKERKETPDVATTSTAKAKATSAPVYDTKIIYAWNLFGAKFAVNHNKEVILRKYQGYGITSVSGIGFRVVITMRKQIK